MKKYALIQNNKIIKFRNIPDDDIIIVIKLLEHKYLPVKEEIIPIHDYSTQMVVDSFEIHKTEILHVWNIIERSFDEAKQIKEDNIKQYILDQISNNFELIDQTIISNIIETKNNLITAIEVAKTNHDLRNIKISGGK